MVASIKIASIHASFHHFLNCLQLKNYLHWKKQRKNFYSIIIYYSIFFQVYIPKIRYSSQLIFEHFIRTFILSHLIFYKE